jgi:hypothetical protein
MMKYEQIGETVFGQKLFGRIDDDGLMRVTCTEDNPEYLAWLNPQTESIANEATAE